MPDDARITLSYLNATESADYIAIMDVLEASVNDLSPVQVASALAAVGRCLPADVVENRLESLREWRAITGTQDTSRILRHSDLLLRNRRYALTQAGRQVHRFYRTVLAVTVTLREIPLASLNRIVRSLATVVLPRHPCGCLIPIPIAVAVGRSINLDAFPCPHHQPNDLVIRSAHRASE